MRQIIEKSFKYKRALCIDADFLSELREIMLRYCKNIVIEGTLSSSTKVYFDSFEELVDYRNDAAHRIISLIFRGMNDKGKYIFLKLSYETSPFFSYTTTATCEYRFSSDEEEIVFKEKIQSLLKSSTCGYWWLGKLGVYSLFTLYAYISTFINFYNGTWKTTWKGAFSHIPMLMICVVFCIILLFVLHLFDKHVWLNLFEPISFCIGKGIERYKNKKTIRSNLFWTVIVGTLISVACSILL